VESSLDDDKAQQVAVIDLAGKTDIADYMVIASGASRRHIGTMADHLLQRLKADGRSGLAAEGEGLGDWVLIDAGDVVVHLFRPEVRAFYDLEKLWATPVAEASRRPRRQARART
jgi:ribosome-associated protein